MARPGRSGRGRDTLDIDMSRITAQKARELSRAYAAFAVDEILAGIEKEASEGKYEFVTAAYGFGSSACYASMDKWPALCQAIVAELRDLGFRADVRVHEKHFVEMWLQVTWKE